MKKIIILIVIQIFILISGVIYAVDVYSHGHGIDDELDAIEKDSFIYAPTPEIVLSYEDKYVVLYHFWVKDKDQKVVLIAWMAHKEEPAQPAWVIYNIVSFKEKFYLSVKRFAILDKKIKKIIVLYDVDKL